MSPACLPSITNMSSLFVLRAMNDGIDIVAALRCQPTCGMRTSPRFSQDVVLRIGSAVTFNSSHDCLPLFAANKRSGIPGTSPFSTRCAHMSLGLWLLMVCQKFCSGWRILCPFSVVFELDVFAIYEYSYFKHPWRGAADIVL